MRSIDMTAEVRTTTGTGAAHKTRAGGKVPAVLYGLKENPLHCSLDAKTFSKLLHGSSGGRQLVNLAVGGDVPSQLALVREIQVHPVTGRVIHVDFLRVDKDKRLKTMIPVHIVGVAAGQALGGTLDVVLREVEVECLPSEIPEFVEINVSHLNVGDSLHVSDLVMPENVRCVTEPGRALASVTAPKVEAAATTAEGEAAAEGAEGQAEAAKEEEK